MDKLQIHLGPSGSGGVIAPCPQQHTNSSYFDMKSISGPRLGVEWATLWMNGWDPVLLVTTISRPPLPWLPPIARKGTSISEQSLDGWPAAPSNPWGRGGILASPPDT